MGKILVVAEKPSVGRDIAKVLKCTKKGDGFLFSDDYVVSWAIGHLVTLCEPEDYGDQYKSWRKDTLPIIPDQIKLKPIADTKKQLNILKKLMSDKDIESLVCATDSGREGELIFRYIYDICKCKKTFQRLWISSMTDTAIKDGFSKLKPGAAYDGLYLSAKCRSESDWLVGINATRAYTIKYNTLLSIGRVQTPTLAILVERQKEIDAFVPTDYWEVKADLQGVDAEGALFSGIWFDPQTNETKIDAKDKAEAIREKVLGQVGIAEKIETEQKKQPPGLLYDLTELQRDCNRRFGFSAKKTLEIAQSLYEKRKMITYPRTDSRYLSKDMIPKLTVVLKKLETSAYGEYAQTVLSLPQLPINKRIVDDAKVTDHHAIIPTEAVSNAKSLTNDEYKVYDVIVRKFLSVFYPHYVYNITRIVTFVADERFLTKGTTVVKAGWMALYRDDKPKKGDDDDEWLPNLKEGESVMLTAADVLQKKTSAPKAYTEGTLLSAMENAGRFVEDEALKEQLKDSGLGTPATRAAIIERLLQVGYVERCGKTLAPTEKGMRLISVVPPEMKSPETTGKWEKGLVSISKGGMSEERFMGSIVKYVHYLVNSTRTSADVVFPKEERQVGKRRPKAAAFGTCPKCGTGEVFENAKSFYCGAWRDGCKFNMWKNSVTPYGLNLTPEIVKTLLKGETQAGLSLKLPQTGEACKGDLKLKADNSGMVEILNIKRL